MSEDYHAKILWGQLHGPHSLLGSITATEAIGRIAAAMMEAEARGAQAEREECARVADFAEAQNLYGSGVSDTSPEEIARAIRARGTPAPVPPGIPTRTASNVPVIDLRDPPGGED